MINIFNHFQFLIFRNQSTEDEPPKEATAKDQPTQQVKAIAEDEPPAEEEPPKEDEPPAAVEETHSYIMQKYEHI